jgi:hypothetical protein
MGGVLVTVFVVLVLLVGLIYLMFGRVPGKMMAIAQASYRETVRQPFFWLLLGASAFFMLVSVVVPYFTFEGTEELKMYKDLQFDAMLLPALIVSLFTAAVSIAEEIEGRTAVTLLSKPVKRWQFLLGKFCGMLFAALLMLTVLSVFFGMMINVKIAFEGQISPAEETAVLEQIKKAQTDQEVEQLQRQLRMRDLPGGADDWVAVKQFTRDLTPALAGTVEFILMSFVSVKAIAPGPVLILCQVMVLTAIAVALATRVPLVVNLIVCLFVFFFGRLTPVLTSQPDQPRLVGFVAQVFGVLFPSLHYYDQGPTLASGVLMVPWSYVLHAWTHGLIYIGIALLFGLILFEDRDVA